MLVKKKSLCRGVKVEKPNKCKKLNGCKVASGPTRKFCRKKRKNRTKKLSKSKRKSK